MKRLFVNILVIVYSLSLITIFLPSVIPDKTLIADQVPVNSIKKKNRE